MSLPYFPMYPSDFEAKTSHLTLAEDGAYNRLLRMCWMTPGCSIPDDEAWIMRRLRAHSEDERQAVRTVISEFFESEDGRLFQPRLRREALLADEKHARRANAGRKGGIAKAALKTNDFPAGNAKAMHKQPEPEPEPEVTTETSVSVVTPQPKKRASRLSENWHLPMEWGEWAVAEGWPESVVRIEAEKFRDFWTAKAGRDAAKLDWQATWRNWMRNSKSPKAINGGKNGEPTDATDRLRRVVTAAARGSSAQDWG